MGKLTEPILITGCARSGTSMIAGIVNICGAFGGEMSPPNSNNKKGMFENIEIRNNIVKQFLKNIGVDPMGQNPLPNMSHFKDLPERLIESWTCKVLRVMVSQGYSQNMLKQSWFYKGAKMCLMWPVWHGAFPDAKWIIVRRDADDIAKSCLRTSFMRAYKTIEDWVNWVDIHIERFDEMKVAGLQVYEVWSQRIVEGDFSEIKEVIDILGLEWKEDEVSKFVSPELWYGRAAIGSEVKHG